MFSFIGFAFRGPWGSALLCEAVRKHRILRTVNSRGSSAYVSNVRKQIEMKKCNRIVDLPYKNGRFLVIDSHKRIVLLSRQTKGFEKASLVWAAFKELEKNGVNIENDAVFLSVLDGNPNFAVNVSSLSEESHKSLESELNAKFVPLRASLFMLDGDFEVPLVSQSHSILDWKLKHNYCSYCGSTLERELIGMQKKCPDCKTVHYPTINPVGISLVCNEEQTKILLVRQPIHPPRMFTCVAGFIESGETVEDNIKREVAEELGLEVKTIQYVGSQHWSLPGNKLMLGCFAIVKHENFSLDPEELEDARWFFPNQIHKALIRVTEKKEKVLQDPDDIWIPPPGAIAHILIKTWLQKQSAYSSF